MSVGLTSKYALGDFFQEVHIFVQQIVFSSKIEYNWTKKESVGRKGF